MRAREQLVSLGLVLVSSGCGAGAEPSGSAASADRTANGTELNGVMFNGVMFNGVMFNGVMFNGTGQPQVRLAPLRLDALRLGGQALAGASLSGGSLTGSLPGGSVVSGSGLAGAELSGALTDGTAVTLRIDGVAAGSQADVQLYDVSVRLPGDDAAHPLCTAKDGSPVRAIPLAGSWDESAGTPTGGAHLDAPGTFTFACEGYALAKCVELGYAPWRTVVECRGPADCAVRSLSQLHQACTRMIRADYCGDGTTTTRDGTQVDVWDHYAIQADAQPGWSLEAEWSPGGAVCIDLPRWATLPGGEPTTTLVQDRCPARWQPPGCGGPGSTFFTPAGFDAPPATRAVLRTRIPRTDS